jgi:hypothetical protein
MKSTRRVGKLRTLIALAACAAFVIAAAPGNGNGGGNDVGSTTVQGWSWR